MRAPKQCELVVTYSVGDYVWTSPIGGRGRVLARVESAWPLKGSRAEVWLVRVRHAGARGWGAPEHRAIASALSGTEVAHNRKLGLIPQPGDPL